MVLFEILVKNSLKKLWLISKFIGDSLSFSPWSAKMICIKFSLKSVKATHSFIKGLNVMERLHTIPRSLIFSLEMIKI